MIVSYSVAYKGANTNFLSGFMLLRIYRGNCLHLLYASNLIDVRFNYGFQEACEPFTGTNGALS